MFLGQCSSLDLRILFSRHKSEGPAVAQIGLCSLRTGVIIWPNGQILAPSPPCPTGPPCPIPAFLRLPPAFPHPKNVPYWPYVAGTEPNYFVALRVPLGWHSFLHWPSDSLAGWADAVDMNQPNTGLGLCCTFILKAFPTFPWHWEVCLFPFFFSISWYTGMALPQSRHVIRCLDNCQSTPGAQIPLRSTNVWPLLKLPRHTIHSTPMCCGTVAGNQWQSLRYCFNYFSNKPWEQNRF